MCLNTFERILVICPSFLGPRPSPRRVSQAQGGGKYEQNTLDRALKFDELR